MIDLSPLADAVASLTDSMALVEESKQTHSERMHLIVLRGLIQAFEYNFALAIGYMETYLVETAAVPDKRDLRDFRELIRVADERRLLLSAFPRWKQFRHARNMTSHTYNQAKAKEVLAVIPEFEREMTHLLSRLKEELAQ